MEELLGPNILLESDKSASIESVLKGKDLVLLYFSASWCPPCKTFTPILSEFYKSCCIPNNVEIIFVSSDNSVESFNAYFASMPWTALPMTSIYRANLGKLLQISSIPQLVVLDATTGYYVTNDARSSVMSVAQNVQKGIELIHSWKNIESVPIEEADLSLLSSMYSKVKTSFGFGTKKETSKSSNQNDKEDDNDTVKVPASLLLSFFQDATKRLESFPNHTTRQELLYVKEETDVSIDSTTLSIQRIPISLDEQRKLLLNEQIAALNHCISSFQETNNCECCEDNNNTTTGTDTSKDDKPNLLLVQSCLQRVGAKDMTLVDGTKEEIQQIMDDMTNMNDVARLAFVRCVLCSELDWEKQFKGDDPEKDKDVSSKNFRGLCHSEEDGQMDRLKLIEFCGMCMTTIKLPAVKQYFKNGSEMFPDTTTKGDDGVDEESNEQDKAETADNASAPPMVSQRVIKIQHTMLQAVGLEPKYGSLELRRHMMEQGNQESENHDIELFVTISNFLTSIQDVGREAMMDSTKVSFSDVDEGGVTRIVSVQHSDGETPSNSSMGQRSEEQMKQEFAMAQKASSLQKEIIDELQSMDEEEREKKLKEAKMVHDIFMKEALDKPPGPERIQFLQNVGSGKQKMLLMHKLWSVMSQQKSNSNNSS